MKPGKSLLVCAMSMLLVLCVSTPCHADLVDPDTGEYQGGVALQPSVPIENPYQEDPEQEDPEPSPEPVDDTSSDSEGVSLAVVCAAMAVAAAGAAAVIVSLGKGRRAEA